jgi:intracellular septation protein
MQQMQRPTASWVKPVVDYGPLALFFAVYYFRGLMPATAVLMGATAVVLLFVLLTEKRVPLMPLITAIVVGVFGGITLWLADETFIKMKPTIVNALIAAVLIGGLVFDKPLLKPLMGTAWQMTEIGWRVLTRRFAVFFLCLAVLNEIVWRTQSTDFWVTFKVFGLIGLTFLFALAQVPLLNRYRQTNGNPAPATKS